MAFSWMQCLFYDSNIWGELTDLESEMFVFKPGIIIYHISQHFRRNLRIFLGMGISLSNSFEINTVALNSHNL